MTKGNGRRTANLIIFESLSMFPMRLACIAVFVVAPLSTACISSAHPAEAVAVAARPFGVGRITVPLRPDSTDLITETNGYLLKEANGRVFYPAFAHHRVLGILRELIGIESGRGPASLTVHFLFKGDEPLELTLQTPQPQTLVVVPHYNPRQFLRMQRAWWQQYAAVHRLQERAGDYPPVVELYLSNMLGQRLGLQPPLIGRGDRQLSLPKESLQLVLNIEAMRLRTLEQTLRGSIDLGVAELPVPDTIAWPPRGTTTARNDVVVEPIAMHVPEECFYLRFGSFDNYLWFRKFTEQNGGSASRLITLRGHDAMVNQKTQAQLGLRETILAELLGNQLISDVALLGRDTYLREGAAIGILFEARNALLKNELSKQQQAAATSRQANGAFIQELMVDGKAVSFASTPDNSLRSFYVIDDRYHLVTNSLTIVERFLECGRGQGALGQSDDFGLARGNFPPSRQDALFAYLSPAFFRGLVSPQYQLELRRRLRAATDLEILALARLAAIHEQLPHERVADLIEAGLLPPDFNRRPDGSQVMLSGEDARDTLRGARGSFLPIPDVPLQGATQEEAARYAEMARFHQRRWTNMDPLVVQLKRTPLPGGARERIDIRAEMLPFERQKYGLVTSIIGPPSNQRIRQPDGNAISAQVVVQGGPIRPQIGTHHLFFGVRDEELPIELSEISLVRILQILRTAPAYLGVWPKLGLLDLFPFRTEPTPDANGLARLPFGLWQLTTPDGFSLVGIDPNVLTQVAPELAIEPDDGQAQVRLEITDVSTSKIKTWFAALDFQRAYATSVGNTRLLHTVRQQLGVPPDKARQATEHVLGVQLICALGGEYQLFEDPIAGTYWGSTHWPSLKLDADQRAQFASPMMAWFRGLKAEVTLLDDRVSGNATLEIQQLVGDKPELPFFDFLRRK